jgi:excisionase family DNA binding protein
MLKNAPVFLRLQSWFSGSMKDLLVESNGQPQTNPRQGLLTKGQCAEYCQVRIRTIDNWMKRGFIPYYKIGKAVRFRIEDVLAFLDRTCRVARPI